MPGETIVSTTVQDAIREVNAEFAQFFSKRDPASIARLYTEDGLIMPPNQDLIRGRNNIEGFWRGIMTAGVRDVVLQTQNVELYGDIVAEIGRFTIFIEEKQVIEEGKYLVLWKQEDGEWKLFRDIWNSSRPIAKP